MVVTTVTPERLADLNTESEECIKRWGVEMASSEALGRYLRSTTGVPAGEQVLLLPPNLIQAFSEVTNYNAVIQVRRSERQEERLYSASLTPDDLDNFLSHSCDPLCVLSVDEEFTVRVVTRRAIASLEPISIDYEQLEEDMVAQGVEFECACGVECCRKRIVGTRARELGA